MILLCKKIRGVSALQIKLINLITFLAIQNDGEVRLYFGLYKYAKEMLIMMLINQHTHLD